MIKLPTERSKAKVTDAGFMILYGKQKTGKSTVCSQLEGALLVDLKREYDFLDGMKVECASINDIVELLGELGKAKDRYKYIVIDNSSWLLEMILPLANKLYRATPLGKNWEGNDVLTLPRGAGYLYQKNAFMQVIESFRKATDRLILIGHLKEQVQIGKDNTEEMEYNLDLPQGLRDLLARNADAIGRFYREENRCMIDFDGHGNITAQARQLHLRGKQICIGESDEQGKITTHWDNIYKDV